MLLVPGRRILIGLRQRKDAGLVVEPAMKGMLVGLPA